MARDLSLRLEELAHGLVGPLILGGTAHLVAPLGPELAFELGVGRRISDDDLRSRIDLARVRQARAIAPIDTLPDISPGEWALIAALNDLLQATNHELSSPFTRGRHITLLDTTERLLAAIEGPRTTIEAIVRHATFARIFELERTDTLVSAWAGTIDYRGQEPEKSMTFWPGLRRVRVDPRKVPIQAMADGFDALPTARYVQLLTELVSRSPLTDFATIERTSPPFAWTRATLELVSYPTGRTLASRALSKLHSQQVLTVLQAATRALPPSGPARPIAESFSKEIVERATATRA
ncbi:MAG: hypothetical protein HOW73_45545 [Polyangiaceae bacterium]|nr:hypothetical protein [Polyangiaceae bacterium]